MQRYTISESSAVRPFWLVFTRLSLWAALLLSSMPDAALAQRDDEVAPPGDNRAQTISRPIVLGGSVSTGGHNVDGDWDGGVYTGVTALYRPAPFAVGLGAQVGGELFGPSEQRVAALAGASSDIAPWFRLDVLAEFGGHFEQPSTGLELFSDDEIVGGDRNAAVPYVGLRLGPSIVFGTSHRMLIGTWWDVRRDLGQTENTYTVRSCGGLFRSSADCSFSERTDTVGGLLLTGGVRFAIEVGPPT